MRSKKKGIGCTHHIMGLESALRRHYRNKEYAHDYIVPLYCFVHATTSIYYEVKSIMRRFERGIISSTRTKRSSSLCLHGRPCQRRRGRSP